MIEVLRGNIVDQDVDAIVNAANPTLLGGGGVDGAIHAAGGAAILAACQEIRRKRYPQGLPPGEAAITTGGNLRARHVIHTVGPVWHGGAEGESGILACCYDNCLSLAASHGLQSIAFPSISTGAFGYPIEKAAPVAIAALRKGLERLPSIQTVRIVLWSDPDLEAYRQALTAAG